MLGKLPHRAHPILAQDARWAGYTLRAIDWESVVKLRSLSVLLAALITPFISYAAVSPVLVVHGGAGVIKRDMTPAKDKAVRAALRLALTDGYARLKAGKPALDAVTAAITVLENDPNFNAGRGAVFTHDGRNELDAAVMDGHTRRAGAVAGVQRVKNPILLARAVMEQSRYVMLAGAGAEGYAQSIGMPLVEPSYFRTEARWQQLSRRSRRTWRSCRMPTKRRRNISAP